MIEKILFTLFLVLSQLVVFAGTNTYTGDTTVGGKLLWSTSANWSLGAVPAITDDVVILSGKTVIIAADAVAKSVNISGTLKVNDGVDFAVSENFTVNSGGSFDMTDENGSGSIATLVVYGDYINNGTTDFWKSTSIIAGDLLSPSTSTIQNNGNVVVGGNIIGAFDTTGGTGAGQIYAINPNATVTITPSTIGGNVTPGVFPSTETSTLIDLVNLAVYGESCLFTINNITNFSACLGSNAVFTVATNASSPQYQWQVNIGGSGWVDLTNITPYSGVTTSTLTISGVTIVMDKYKYRAKITGLSPSCIKNGNYGVLTVSAVPATPTASATAQPTCSTTGTITVTAPTEAGMAYSIDGSTYTNTTGIFTSVATGSYAVTAKSVFGCISNATSVAINVQPVTPTAPAIGVITQPTNPVSTGSVVLSGLPASGTWTLTRSGTSSASTTGTGTSTTISGLLSGTYSFTVSNATCTSVVSSNVVINATTNTWNVVSGVGSWTNGTPTSIQAITFNGDYVSSGDLAAYSCTVNAGILVTINSGHTLTLTNELTVASSGSMTFQNNASLIQINNVSNSGGINYIRTTNDIVRKTDYTYWSSPVLPQTLGDLSPNTANGMMYSYNSSIENWKQEYLSTPMVSGVGYIVRGPEPSEILEPPSLYTATFAGVPNNGDYSITGMVANRSCLLGNPYPSALNADVFLTDNSAVLDGTLYFWTHKTQIGIGVSDPGTGAYAYSGDDYASYNFTGGVGVGSAALSGSGVPTGKIAAGQGFFATSIAAGTVIFNNSMRVSGNNTQFFKTKKPKQKATEKHRIWLNLSNTQGAFKQALIGYLTDATNNHDIRFDGESFDGNEFVDFYSINQDMNLVIQGRALPFEENDEVPLGYRTTINGSFTINIDQTDGLLTNQAVFLEDKLTNVIFDLKSGSYTFSTVPGTFNNRFVLRYSDSSINKTLEKNNFDTQENGVLVSNTNKQIQINAFTEKIDKVALYDLLGKQIYHKISVNSSELSIADLVSSHQTLIVKTSLQNGEIVMDKIVF